MLLTNGAYAAFFASPILDTLLMYRYRVTNQPIPGFFTNRTTPPQAARAAASEDHSRALRASTDRLPVDWRRPRGRPRQSCMASNNRERSQTAHPWTSLCIAARNGSSFLVMNRGNGYALRACHQVMMMMHRIPPPNTYQP